MLGLHNQDNDIRTAKVNFDPMQVDEKGRVVHEYLKHVLKYDPTTGRWARRTTTASNARAGSEAGCRDSQGYLRIWVSGRVYFGHVLAWFYQTGDWPGRHSLKYKNGIPGDDRWENLMCSR